MKRYKMIYLITAFILLFSYTNRGFVPTKGEDTAEDTRNLSSTNNINSKLKYTSGIRSILQDRKGNYWFGSHQEGVCLFDGTSFTYFTVEDGLSANQVRSIQEDETGTIWFGTANGVSSYHGEKIVNHALKGTLPELELTIHGQWTTTDNNLWFNAGNEAGAYRFDGQKLDYLAFPVEEDKRSFNSYGVTGFSKGKEGTVWIATYAAAFGFDEESFKIINNKSLGYLGATGNLHIRSILEDSKGNLWIGNNGIGVLLVKGDSTINFSDQQGLIDLNSTRNGNTSPKGTLEHVFAIREDRNGNIWFGDRDTGAWKYDGKSMINYTIDSALATPHVWDIYENRNGELLFAMGSGGVYKFEAGLFERKF